MDLFMDDMEVIPALPPINDGDCKEDEDCASATEKIKGSGDTITSQSIKEQPNKSDQFASPPTPSRGETMPRDAEELSTEAAIEGSIQRSYEIMNESTDILKDKDASDFFNDSPSPTWGEKAIPSGNASDKCGANDDDSTEEHLDLSVEDADDSDYNANNEAKHSKIAVGDSATSTKPENIRSDDKNSKKSASGNAMQFNDDDSMDSNAEAPFVNSNPEVIMMFRYYAVRVGYARASFFREDEDGLEKQYETRYFNKAAPMVKIRSAIFLYWDDARQFLENIENLDKDSSLEFKVEYDGFDSIAEAEAYLLEPDTNLAWEHATSSGMTYPEVEDRNQIPATSYYYNFHEQYPLPHLHIPYLLPFAPFASEINTMPIVPGKPFYGVPDDREMNLAPSSIETRSRAKSTRTSIIATPLPTNKSNLTRGRPKAGTRKPNLRPQPKNLTSKENEEQKEANIIPATSYYYGFRDQYPVPRYYFPYTSPLVPVTNELGVHPITELNLASASVKTRSKTKVTRASAPKTTPRKMKSKPARERPKAVRIKPIQRPKPKKLTAKEYPLTSTPITRQLTPESAVSDELEDKKIMNPRPPKVTQSRKPPKKKFEAIQNCDPHGKDLKRDEPEPVRQSQEKDTKVKKPEERKEEIMEKKWTTMFQKLLDYKKQYHGSLDTLFSGEDIKKCETAKGTATTKLSTEEREIRKLRRWCEEQKRLHFKWAQDKSSSSFFTQEKYDKLKEVGFDFPEPRWDEQYKKLKAYKDTHGTLKVERKHDLCLYRWSVRQRNILGKHFEGKPVNMSQERLKKLAELGWQKALDKRSKVRDKANEQKKWDEKFQELLMYKEKNGHMSFSPCNIKNDEFIRIRYWVRKIRKEYQKLQSGKESTLTAMQMKRLSDIGFDFNPHGINGNKSHKERWELRLQALKEYKARKGDFTLNEREDPKMYNIILNIRKAYKAREKGAKNGLTDERIAQLEEIGFDFTRRKAPTVRDVPRSWEERFQQLLQFKEEFGHCQVPLNYGGVLGDWVRRQRMFYRKLMAGEPSPLTHEKALRLSSVGFCFE